MDSPNNAIPRPRYFIKWRSGRTSWTFAGLKPDLSFYGWYSVLKVRDSGEITSEGAGGLEGRVSPADYDRIVAFIDAIRLNQFTDRGAGSTGVLGEGTISTGEIFFRLHPSDSPSNADMAFSSMAQILDEYARRATAHHLTPPP
jgi:hypothetical protein